MDLSKYFPDQPAELNLERIEPEAQLLKIYAYNAYFNADPVEVERVNDGTTRTVLDYAGIDGVFVNETLEENTIECLHVYYVGGSSFTLNEVYKSLDRISAAIDEAVNDHRKLRGNEAADRLLRDYLDESDEPENKKPKNKKVIIRIITDYACGSDEEKYELNKKIEGYSIAVKKLEVSAVIVFADDIIAVIESNRAPFDWVEEGKVRIDEPGNFLKYGDHSIVCNISAQSLKKLWQSDGSKGLLAMNLRYYIKSKNIDGKIEDSILRDSEDFWYLNNGIIIVCNDFKIDGSEVRLKQFSIVNGGQTSRMIGEIPFNNDFFISCKIIKNIFDTPKEKNAFIAKVAEASNTQKPIKAKDIIANRVEQRNLKSMLSENGVFIEIKRGEKCVAKDYPEPWQRTKNNELAQDLYAFVNMKPGPARNSVSSILSNEDKYRKIFQEHEYSFEFLRDLLFLEKAFKEYQKAVKKRDDEGEDAAIRKGLVKNGLWYCLGTIGYVLKLHYNREFRNDMEKYRNFPTKYELCSSELAFMHGFVDRDFTHTYKEFKNEIFGLFDAVFTNLLIPEFKKARSGNPDLAYSNWMKANTGFNDVRSTINLITFDTKQTYIIDAISQYFAGIDEDTENANIDRYADLLSRNKKSIAKDRLGYELSDKDTALRNELMEFRLKYSQQKHLAENVVYTDKMIDLMVAEKPATKAELKKILRPNTFYYISEQIIAIINKYL